MKKTAVALCALGTPALAHHEVVVASSMMPVVVTFATIAAGVLAAWRSQK